MKLNVGDIIEIKNEKCTICYETELNNERYICVAFERDIVYYDIYKYKFENDKLLVSQVTNEDEVKKVLDIFVEEGIDQFGLQEDLERIFKDYLN